MTTTARKVDRAGVQRRGTVADAIDEETGQVNVFELLPEAGDSVMIVNCGDHFEVRHHRWRVNHSPQIFLTDEDIELLKRGQITWN